MALNFTDKAGILGELWINFRDDENFEPFIDYPKTHGLPSWPERASTKSSRTY